MADPELEALRKRKLEQLRSVHKGGNASMKWPSEPVHISDLSFRTTITGFPLVLVDFWAEWCAPCLMVAPAIERLAKKFQGKVVFAKLDVDSNQSVAASFNVRGIPTLILFKNGEVAERITGALPGPELERLISRYVD